MYDIKTKESNQLKYLVSILDSRIDPQAVFVCKVYVYKAVLELQLRPTDYSDTKAGDSSIPFM